MTTKTKKKKPVGTLNIFEIEKKLRLDAIHISQNRVETGKVKYLLKN
ncbi:hypothetical protein JJC03_09275 [Flavobacterium oreochromis]|nr:hypothetical protein [Flavobacterium oreochromis]QYS85429.1 hypothetical protein JJC03_09275 [Flavobacterium oreochromis]